MGNKFYDAGEQRAAKVNDLFGSIARRYDLMNDLQSFGLHRAWKRKVVELAEVRPGNKALDLCCGTGDIAFALARQGAEVTGLDFSKPMLAVAEERARKLATAVRMVPSFQVGDAESVPFADNIFDVVTVGYGLRNLVSWEKGLAEMQRTAKPGGKVVVLDFGKPENRLWRSIYFGYMGLLVPILGAAVCGNPSAYSYILESLKHYSAQKGVEAKMRQLGMINVRTFNLLGGVMGINYGEKSGWNVIRET